MPDRQHTIVVGGQVYKLSIHTPKKAPGIRHVIKVDDRVIGEVWRDNNRPSSKRFQALDCDHIRYGGKTLTMVAVTMAYAVVRRI